ncbi:DUF4431 domain-containing protein [Legionella brunensis]|uniref:DUF4431 domain-containing protein n=1 Tax=Legionella brunensis TaxID=29422 RepID=A0A0W0SL21_9GAMM|nr:DUF4431 domain-containing protein [Legionella brunensis]KTC84054.1 hypothetical protein Lbru_1415 [Legionella brunensis]
MKILAYLLLLCSSVSSLAQSNSLDNCLIEGNDIKLTGQLGVQQFPGPPDYTSIAKGDKPESYWILTTQHPYCGEGQDLTSGKSHRLDEKSQHFQLVLTPKQYEKHRNLLNKQIIVKGQMFIAHTAHHHTPMLIEVSSMEAAP